MKEDLFLKRYKELNKGQKEAVDTIEGPVMVIAGPGTGKTTVLTLRIANILRNTDTPPDGILALTFTDSGVVSMRRKLVSMIGPAAYRVGIYTFHGFAEEIISKHAEYFPRILGGSVATESEKLSILEDAIQSGTFELIRPFGSPLHYVRGALHTISDLKRDAVSPQGLLDVLIREEQSILFKEDLKHEKGKYAGEIKSAYKDALKNIAKNRELASLYEAYEKGLSEKNLYDFDDMLLELLRAFKEHPD
ncbi:MAG: UvrD/REP helicase, helicase / ATP-dependent helicase PcrA, partial [Parcubacteria group bacterium]|nr:UvrD/REP helicase, helicase / ATP-dependent helicase PcrA [Parcubacteria group bacterium]